MSATGRRLDPSTENRKIVQRSSAKIRFEPRWHINTRLKLNITTYAAVAQSASDMEVEAICAAQQIHLRQLGATGQ